MRISKALLLVLFLVCIVIQASSQGYAGTITTGTGILPPITVGSGATRVQGTSMGTLATQVNLTGIWSIELRDSQTRQLELNVFQNGGVVLGYGNMTSDGKAQEVTAAGSVAGGKLDLFVTVIDSGDLYRLELLPSGNSLGGRYDAYSAMGNVWSGIAKGSINKAHVSLSSEPIVLGRGVNASSIESAAVGKVATLLSSYASVPGSLDQSIRNRRFSSTYDGTTTTTSSGDTTVTTNYG